MYETWKGLNPSFDELKPDMNLPNNGEVGTLDEAYVEKERNVSYVGKMTGFFVASGDSDYAFAVRGKDKVKLYLSKTNNPADKV